MSWNICCAPILVYPPFLYLLPRESQVYHTKYDQSYFGDITWLDHKFEGIVGNYTVHAGRNVRESALNEFG